MAGVVVFLGPAGPVSCYRPFIGVWWSALEPEKAFRGLFTRLAHTCRGEPVGNSDIRGQPAGAARVPARPGQPGPDARQAGTPWGARLPRRRPAGQPTSSKIEKIGMYRATIMPPMSVPRMAIISGSMSEVSCSVVAVTSSS